MDATSLERVPSSVIFESRPAKRVAQVLGTMPQSRPRASVAPSARPSEVLAAGRSGVPSATPGPNAPRGFPLPQYQDPVAPLDEESQRKLARILGDLQHGSKLEESIKRAATILQESAGEINDKLTERNEQVRRRKARRERQIKEGSSNVEDEKDIEEQEMSLEEMRGKVDGMTKRMETTMRKCIDGYAGLDNLNTTVKELSHTSRVAHVAASEYARQKEQSQQETQQSQRRRVASGNEDSDDNNDADSEGNVTQIPNTAQQGQTQTHAPAAPHLTPAFNDTLQRHNDCYTSISLSNRYSEHPDYTQFKRIIHDAQYPSDNAPPLPHHTTWFAKEEGRSTQPAPGETARDAEDSDDDIAIAAVKISTRCPLTLLEFKDPVTSTKCNHSFEKSVIIDMIRARRPPTRGRGQGPPEDWQAKVQCPVGGCDKELSESDLQFDPVLVRKIKRIQRAKADREASGEGDQQADEVESVDVESGDDVDEVTGTAATARSVKGERMRATLGEDVDDGE